MKFKGDIIITDPCYIDTEDSKLWDDKSGKFDLYTGSGLEYFGFTNYIYEDTIYGDWSCTTYEKGTNKVLGKFCADAGLVGVFLLEEVLKFNPEFDYHINNVHACTLIKDFDGDITYEIADVPKPDDHDEDEDGEWEEQEAQIHGQGNINFFTTQTGA